MIVFQLQWLHDQVDLPRYFIVNHDFTLLNNELYLVYQLQMACFYIFLVLNCFEEKSKCVYNYMYIIPQSHQDLNCSNLPSRNSAMYLSYTAYLYHSWWWLGDSRSQAIISCDMDNLHKIWIMRHDSVSTWICTGRVAKKTIVDQFIQ